MARAQPIQTNMTAGALSPRMRGRVDVARYANGVEILENYIVMPQGGAYRRSATRFVAAVYESTKKAVLVPFEFSTVQAYMLQFEDNLIRFYKDQNPIVTATYNITGVSLTNPVTITSVGHGLVNGDKVLVGSILGTVELNNREFTVSNVALNSFDLSGINGTAYTAYVSGGTVSKILEVTTTYTEAELPSLQFTQSADTLFITAQGHKPASLSRTSHTTWTLSDLVFVDGPYMPEEDAITVTPSGTTGSVTLTASAALFSANDVGRQIRLLHSSSWSYATITAYTNSTTVTATVGSQATVASASSKYRLGSFYTGNYPQSVVFHENRLVFGNTPAEPHVAWLSYSGKYYTFSPTDLGSTTVVDSSGFNITIVSNKVNAIQWLVSGTVLSIGTVGAEWVVKAGTTTEALSPTNYGLTEQTPWGSKLLRAIRIGSAVIFVTRSGRKLREHQYVYQNDAFEARDISLLGEHLLRINGSKVSSMAYQQNPDSVLWLVRDDGGLVGMTYLKEQDVIAFHSHVLGGNYQGGDPVVESVAVIPNLNGDSDQLWLIVKRTVNGATVRYVEYMEDPFLPDSPTDKDGMFFLDCGITYSGASTLTISGLWHLRGEALGVCADAAVKDDVVVSSTGVVTLDEAATLVQLGYQYDSTLKPLPPEGGNPYGSAQGKIKRVTEATVRVLDTLSLSYSADGVHWTDYPFRSESDPPDVAPPLFTGDIALDLEADFGTDGTYYIRQSNPYPSTIIALMPKYNVTET